MPRRRRGQVIGVRCAAVSDEFRVDLCSPVEGERQFFQNDNAAAFGDDKAVASLVEGAAGFFRLVIAERKRAHCAEPRNAERRDRGFNAAGNHGVRVAVGDDFVRVAERRRSGSAGRHSAIDGAFGAEAHGNMAGRQIGQNGRYGER